VCLGFSVTEAASRQSPTNLKWPVSRTQNIVDQLRGVFRQPEIIVGTWRAARAEQDDVTEDEAREALLQLDPLWDELFPAEQARVIQLLVDRVDVHREGVDVRFRINGIGVLAREAARRAA
jgi:site-specific DNA recombinase